MGALGRRLGQLLGLYGVLTEFCIPTHGEDSEAEKQGGRWKVGASPLLGVRCEEEEEDGVGQ